MSEEKDLILGEEAEELEQESEEAVDRWFQEREDARADIDAAICAYNFLEELDLQSPEVLRWNLKRKLTQTMKNCLLIIAASIDELVIQKEEEEDDDDE